MSDGRDLLMMGWYDPDKKRSVAEKVAAGAERYAARFGAPPTVCRCNPVDAAELPLGGLVVVTATPSVPRHTFYLGRWEDADDGDR